MVSGGRIASGWLGLTHLAGRCHACGGPLDTPTVVGSHRSIYAGEIYICTDCLVKILVKSAVAVNYHGSMSAAASDGLGRAARVDKMKLAKAGRKGAGHGDTDRRRVGGGGVRLRVDIGPKG